MAAGHLINKAKGAEPKGPVLGYSRPVAIKVPAINVSSKVNVIGKNADGTIAVPDLNGPHRDQAAWYKYSPAPGEYGAAVIEGHVDTYKYGPSVFFNLGKLKPGDKVLINRKGGKKLTFDITAVRAYPKDMFPTAAVYKPSTNRAELRLITCGGAFNYHTDHYTKNIVVFAHLTSVGG
jgi:sortase (surface protein transpeptidase)